MKYEVLTQYGEFTKEAGGRLNGHVLYVGGLPSTAHGVAAALCKALEDRKAKP